MLVVEKARRISVEILGEGLAEIQRLIQDALPDAVVTPDSDEAVPWRETSLAKGIKAAKTPGKLLRAYRVRAGLNIVELASKIGTKYPNISAMENDRRAIGLNTAKKLGKVLGVSFEKFLET